MEKFLENCLLNIASAAKKIQISVSAMIGYMNGQDDADNMKTETQRKNEVISGKTLIQEVEEMLIELKIKGSIRERTNGLLEFRNPNFGSVYGRSVEELKINLTKKLREEKSHTKKTVKRVKSPLLSTFYKENYLPYKKNEKLADNTLKGIEYNFNIIMKSGFDKHLHQYTSNEIEDFLYSIEKTRTRQIIQGLLNNMFKRAMASSLIKDNPCAVIEKMKHKKTEGRAISFEEQKIFFENLFESEKLSYQEKCYFVFVYLTGCRRNEALSLNIKDADLKRNVLHISGTKTEKSVRFIPAFSLVAKLLKSIHTPNLFFPIKEKRADNLFGKFISGYKLHDLRHTFGTIQICVEKIDFKTVSLWLGHSNIQTTLKIYTHPEHLDNATFLRGDLTETEKNQILKNKYKEILSLIDKFITDHTQNVPKN